MSESPQRPARGRRRDPDELIDVHAGASRQTVRKGVSSGVRWTAGSQFASQATKIVMALVLARLLEPDDFGLVALLTVATGFFERVLGDTGTTSAIVRHRQLTQGLASSVFFWNLLVGSTTAAALAVFASPIARLLGEPDADNLLRLLGLMALINAAGYVQRALLRRLAEFRRLGITNYANAGVTAAVTIGLAITDPGPRALVLGNLAGSAASLALAWILSGWVPSLVFRRRYLSQISGFSANMSAQNVFGYISFAGDRFIIGRFLGPTELGYYGMSNRLMRYPLQATAQTFREVVFPTLSRLQDDDDALLETYRRTVAGISFALMPLCLTIASVSHPLVAVTLGAKWEPVGTLLGLMALVGALQAVATTPAALYLAKGRPDLLLRWQMGSSLILMICYSVGAIWGSVGVASGFLFGIALLFYPAFAIPLRLVDAPASTVFRAMRPSAVGSLLAAAGALSGRFGVEALGGSDWAQLGAGLAGGLLVFGVHMLVTRPQAAKDLTAVVAARASELAK